MAGAFVTGGSGFIGGRLIERLRARRPHRARARALAIARPSACARAVPSRSGRPRRPRRDARRRRGLRARLPRRRDARRLGHARGVRARQRRGHARTCCGRAPRPACGASSTSAPRPRCSPGEPLVERRRDRAAAAGLAGALQLDQGARRAGCAGRQPRRLRDGRRAAAVRLGRRRHDAAAGDGRDGAQRALRLDRRRPPPDLDHARRQHRRGPGARRRARARRATSTSSPTASRSSSASSSPSCSPRRASRRRRAAFPLAVASALARAGEASWRRAAAPGPPAADPLRLLGLLAGVHDPHRQGRASSSATSPSRASPRASLSCARPWDPRRESRRRRRRTAARAAPEPAGRARWCVSSCYSIRPVRSACATAAVRLTTPSFP